MRNPIAALEYGSFSYIPELVMY